MRKVKKSDHEGDNFYYIHVCPGCNEEHLIPSWGNWQFNGDFEKPTFSPSVKNTYRRNDTGEERVCHYFIRDGQIEYCSGSMHLLAGQTVPLPTIEEPKPEVPDFDLPDPDDGAPKVTKPRIHIGGDTCVSCEG